MKLRKISREKFVAIMDGKHVSLISACVVGKEMFEKALKSLDDTEKYLKVTTTPIDSKYVGVFHKQSNGFYRLMSNGDKSFKYFSKGDYVLSDGKLSFIINPFTMNVCVYRLETLFNINVSNSLLDKPLVMLYHTDNKQGTLSRLARHAKVSYKS